MSAHALPPTWPMFRALVGIGMLCGLLIAVVYQGTLPIIEKNRAEALERAIFAVLPAATARRTFSLGDAGRFVADVDEAGSRLYAGYDDEGALVGVAIEAAGMGYADTISILYGYSPGQQAITGIQVLASKETPGLGDKIETDTAFLENFVALDARLDADGTAPAHPIQTVKSGEKTEPWQIDGITGATISSQAIGAILASSTARWLPLLHAQLDTFVAGEGVTDGGT
jgi:electron transport complex protein RnfG